MPLPALGQKSDCRVIEGVWLHVQGDLMSVCGFCVPPESGNVKCDVFKCNWCIRGARARLSFFLGGGFFSLERTATTVEVGEFFIMQYLC